jgi:hypothetical protein
MYGLEKNSKILLFIYVYFYYFVIIAGNTRYRIIHITFALLTSWVNILRILFQLLESGYRMECPPGCPNKVYRYKISLFCCMNFKAEQFLLCELSRTVCTPCCFLCKSGGTVCTPCCCLCKLGRGRVYICLLQPDAGLLAVGGDTAAHLPGDSLRDGEHVPGQQRLASSRGR